MILCWFHIMTYYIISYYIMRTMGFLPCTLNSKLGRQDSGMRTRVEKGQVWETIITANYHYSCRRVCSNGSHQGVV